MTVVSTDQVVADGVGSANALDVCTIIIGKTIAAIDSIADTVVSADR